jgi:hypothetical protein
MLCFVAPPDQSALRVELCRLCQSEQSPLLALCHCKHRCSRQSGMKLLPAQTGRRWCGRRCWIMAWRSPTTHWCRCGSGGGPLPAWTAAAAKQPARVLVMLQLGLRQGLQLRRQRCSAACRLAAGGRLNLLQGAGRDLRKLVYACAIPGQLHVSHDCRCCWMLAVRTLRTCICKFCRLSSGRHAWQDKPQGFVPELERITKQVYINSEARNASAVHGIPELHLGELGSTNCCMGPHKINREVSHPAWWATQGHRSLLSSPWYLNLGKYGEENWQRYHAVEPLAFEVNTCLLTGRYAF